MRKAVVSYEVTAAPQEKEQALLAGLGEVLYELLAEHGWEPESLIDRCVDEVQTMTDEIASEPV